MPLGVVAMLDALGVRGMWARSRPEDVERQVQNWRTIINLFNVFAIRATTAGRFGRERLVHRCQIYAFSDTVFITMEGNPLPIPGHPGDPPRPDQQALLMLMGDALAPAFYAALAMGFYFRGAITTGEFYEGTTGSEPQGRALYASQPLLIGPAIDNAAEWYEQADWMGILVAPNATYTLDLLASAGGDVHRVFKRYDIPMKPTRESGAKTRNLWAVAWPRFAVAEAESDAQRVREEVLSIFSQQPIGVIPMSKYENTLKFFKDCIDSE